ncbi:MAG: glycoside hydrolase family 3 N-terminal domain-containing protein [Patescibacteria group bacterium]
MKNKTTLILMVILAIFAVLAGYNYFNKPILKYLQGISEKNSLAEKINQLQNQQESAEDKLLKQYSTEEKIHQLLAVPVVINKSTDSTGGNISTASALVDSSSGVSLAWVESHLPGAVVIFGERVSSDSAKFVIDEIKSFVSVADLGSQEKRHFLPIIAVDHEGGSVQRLSGTGFSDLPPWRSICGFSAEKQAEIFTQSASELAGVGVNMILAPSLDLAESHRVFKDRFCGDQEQLYQAADSMIMAFARQGIISVVKHFPGIGQTTLDLHKTEQEVDVSLEEMQMFQAILDKYANIGVMSAHLIVKDRFSGTPCSLSSECLGYLRRDYPQVLVMSDAIEMRSALMVFEQSGQVEPATDVELISKASTQAILAGNDLVVFGRGVSENDLQAVIGVLVDKYQGDAEFRKRVDESFIKVVGLKK